MGAETLSSRAVIGRFFRALEQSLGSGWIDDVSMEFNSDQPSETYPWLGQVPTMREWIGGRQAKGFSDNGITIANKHYEATIEFLTRDLRRDKTGQIDVRIGEFADRAQAHWASLLSTLMINAESAVCYDGQYFFDTDHAEGDSGTQSNKLSITLSGLPAAVHGSTTVPSAEEMAQCIMRAIQAIQGFKDDRGEPMNENAAKFRVIAPTSLASIAATAASVASFGNGATNPLAAQKDYSVAVSTNARLNAWTTKFAVYRADGRVKPFIRQQETPVQLKAKAEGSEFEFDYDMWQFGIDTWRNVGYGFWQDACLVTMA